MQRTSKWSTLVFVAVIAFALAGLQGGPRKSESPSEILRSLDSADLSIAQFINGRFLVVPFRRRIAFFDRPDRFFTLSETSADGRKIVGFRDGKFSVVDQHLEVVWARMSLARNVVSLAVSPDATKIVFAANDRSGRMNTLVLLPMRGTEKTLQIVPLERDDSARMPLSWDREGGRIAYASRGEIWILDVGERWASSVALGTVPTWSPDGRKIAYRSPSGEAKLLEVATGKSVTIGVAKRSVSASLHWSPDSEYVFVNEELRPAPVGTCVTNSRIVVYRLLDLAKIVAYDPCGARDSTFGWLSGSSIWLKSASGYESAPGNPRMH
jgi:dipeptidyl aminopeptidase/acylaminoacyl peptidase